MNPVTAWVLERESIRKKRESRLPPPWTEDPIFRMYRFCNYKREDDKVTRWIANNWRIPNSADPDVFFAMTVARYLNLPEALFEIGYPVPWNPKKFMQVIRARKARGVTAYNAAYMISMSGKSGFTDKAEFLAKAVLSPLWKHRAKVRPQVGDTLESFHQRLLGEMGLGSFMAAQVVADTKYVGPLAQAADWWEWAASGPGSRRGLNRVLGLPVKSPWTEARWRKALAELRLELKPEFEKYGIKWCHAQDTQNCLCEVSKYLKVKLDGGRAKQRYRGGVPDVFSA